MASSATSEMPGAMACFAGFMTGLRDDINLLNHN